jgi:hypothetical protein
MVLPATGKLSSKEAFVTALRRWFKILRPLFWWFLLVLILLGIHTHERLIAKTRLTFSISLQGQPDYGATVTLDGKPAVTGQLISLGSHRFVVTHPKGDSFSTNLSIWYGEHNLGEINLVRTRGTLSVVANPPASTITITGPEYSLTMHNSLGTNVTLPTDQYQIRAQYPHWSQSKPVTVFSQTPSSCAFSPQLGAVHVTCNHDGASYGLAGTDGQTVEAGNLPATVAGLPAGSYRLNVQYHNYQLQTNVLVKAEMTNEVPFEFLLGAVRLESVPSGATVQSPEGKYLGQTPLDLSDVPIGNTTLAVERTGYAPVQLMVAVAADKTNVISTNLVSLDYLDSTNAARKFQAAANYIRASTAVNEALASKADDADALALQKQINGLWNIQQAKTAGGQGDYAGGIKQLRSALALLPNNDEAKQLLADYQTRAAALIEQARLLRLNRPKQVFDSVLTRFSDYSLFGDHEMTTSKPVKDTASAIGYALQWAQPKFNVTDATSPQPETYVIIATQDVTSVAPKGLRRCIVVCGQTTDTETKIVFKVMEYKGEADVKFSLGNLVNAPVSENYTAINPAKADGLTDAQKAQIQDGTQIVTGIIQKAVEQ